VVTLWSQVATCTQLNPGRFNFQTLGEYQQNTERLHKLGCEEFELQCIDGDHAELFEVAGVCQANLHEWLEMLEEVEVTISDKAMPVNAVLCRSCDVLQRIPSIICLGSCQGV